MDATRGLSSPRTPSPNTRETWLHQNHMTDGKRFLNDLSASLDHARSDVMAAWEGIRNLLPRRTPSSRLPAMRSPRGSITGRPAGEWETRVLESGPITFLIKCRGAKRPETRGRRMKKREELPLGGTEPARRQHGTRRLRGLRAAPTSRGPTSNSNL